MTDGHLIVDGNGTVVQASADARRLLPVADGEQLVGADADDLFGRVEYTDRGDGEFEGQYVDEGSRYVEVETASLEDDGFAIGRLVLLRDVTETVDTRSELERERKELDALFGNISDPVAEVYFESGTPVVQRVNPAFERTFGYDDATVCGENLGEYVVPGEEGESVVDDHLEPGESVRTEVVRETADGPREFLLQVAVTDCQSDAVYAIYTDITDRKERERELERQNQRLEEFASMVSHDLRNPLNVAREYLRTATDVEDPGEFVDEALTSLDRMEAMIEDVLTLAREGRDVSYTEAVELEPVARMAWDNADTGNATLSVEESIRLRADPDRLMELFENLFRNSVDHGPEDVTVTVGSLGGSRGFFVADDGPGIPENRRDDVVEFGVTTHPEGTGLGLAIVNRIASAHEWDLDVTAAADGGARFEFVVGDPDESFQWMENPDEARG